MAKETPDGQEKTEEASGKRLSDARDKGQVAKSMDVISASLLLFGGLFVSMFGPSLTNNLMKFMQRTLSDAALYNITEQSVPLYFTKLIGFVAMVLLPILAAIAFIALAAEISQVGFHFSTKKFTEINLGAIFNPINGLKRMMFSKNSLVEIAKGLSKILIVGLVVYSVLSTKTDQILTLMNLPFQNIAIFISKVGFEVMLKSSLVYALFAAGDYIYQKRRHKEELMMTKQEVKEETKQTEGDVQMKQRIRQIARQRLRKVMLQRAKEADVIITNPTHYAVALKYDALKSTAPIVVAKGVDFLALKIREIGTEAKVPIVEDAPLARALYASVEVDQEIPENLFKAVAQILAYVFRMKKQK